MKYWPEYCVTCMNQSRCKEDAGWREACTYEAGGSPTLYEQKTFRGIDRRKQILDEAAKCVCTDRNQQYGEPEDSFSVIAELWEPYIRTRCVQQGAAVNITATDVCNLMALFKIGRAATAETQKTDTYIDIAGYAACAGGMIE